jgi:uncharacterized protein (TIGR02246 family)
MQNRTARLCATLALASLAACAAPTPGTTGTPEDEQAVRTLVDQYIAGYNARDTAAMAAMVARDYEAVDPMGQHIQGRDNYSRMLAQEFAMMPAGGTLTATTDFLRWAGAEHAVAGGTWTTSPAVPGMPSKGSWMGVMVKEDGAWKMMTGMATPDITPLLPADTTRAR